MGVCFYEFGAVGGLFFSPKLLQSLLSFLHELGYTLQLHNIDSDQADVVSRAKPEWGAAPVLC